MAYQLTRSSPLHQTSQSKLKMPYDAEHLPSVVLNCVAERRPKPQTRAVLGLPERTVNEAARLSELAKAEDGHVLASDVALRCALDLEPLSWDIGELVELRGRAAPTRVARPVLLLATSALVTSRTIT